MIKGYVFTKDVKMGNVCVRIYFQSLILKETEIKIPRRHHLISVKMTITKRTESF